MSDLPAISLIVLNLNGRRHLENCLSSLASLDYPSALLEVILCDNGSTDGSATFVKRRFPQVKVVQLDRNYGFAEGNNRAAQQARFPWVGFLNNDMRVAPDWLHKLVAPLAEKPGLACLSSRILNWDGSAIDFIGSGISFEGHGFQVDQGQPASVNDLPRRLLSPCGGAMLIRRQVFDTLGGFDRDYFAFFEDADLGWRLNLLGYDVWFVPAATVYHRLHGTSQRFPAHRLRVLYERNALFTIYKCLDDDNLAVVLPAAMMLLNERALGLSGLDLDGFRVSAMSRAQPPRNEPIRATAPAIASLREKAANVWHREGPAGLLRKTVPFARRRGSAAVNRVRERVFRDVALLPPLAVSHYVALSEFGHALETLQEKRRWLQERRTRTDAELFPLFVDPVHPSWNDPRYVAFFQHLVRVLGIDLRFSSKAPSS